jgi:hypothetical protein
MAKGKTFLFLFWFVCWGYGTYCQPVLKRVTTQREKVISIAESQLPVRELTGNNDGPDIKKYLKDVGLKEGYAWCAAFVSWCLTESGIWYHPQSAYSPDWFQYNVVYERNNPPLNGFISRKAQVFGIYFESKGRVAHVGFITGEDRLHYYTIEGNTNAAGSREGDGVYRKIRRKTSIFVIADHVGAEEFLKDLKNKGIKTRITLR